MRRARLVCVRGASDRVPDHWPTAQALDSLQVSDVAAQGHEQVDETGLWRRQRWMEGKCPAFSDVQNHFPLPRMRLIDLFAGPGVPPRARTPWTRERLCLRARRATERHLRSEIAKRPDRQQRHQEEPRPLLCQGHHHHLVLPQPSPPAYPRGGRIRQRPLGPHLDGHHRSHPARSGHHEMAALGPNRLTGSCTARRGIRPSSASASGGPRGSYRRWNERRWQADSGSPERRGIPQSFRKISCYVDG